MYNADGVLVRYIPKKLPDPTLLPQTDDFYTQDLAAPLCQILSDGTSTFVYGQERLFAQASGGARLWYATDTLGSVRQTLNDSGAVLGNVAYDPWGQVQSGSIPTFGFTGELQQGANVYLRARWYNTARGTFTAKDPFAGWPEQPQSLHVYMYAKNDPINLSDRTGLFYCEPAGTFPYQNIEYAEYCQRQRTRLLNDPVYMGYRSHDMLGSLIYLFTDPRLPGGAQQPIDHPYTHTTLTGLFSVTPAQERLDFVLWLTQTPSRGTQLASLFDIGPHFNNTFVRATGDDPQRRSDTGFGEQFRDGHLWPSSDRQVGHFLTAVRMGRADKGAHCAVGHEFSADGTRSEWHQCVSGELDMFAFFAAVEADVAGNFVQHKTSNNG